MDGDTEVRTVEQHVTQIIDELEVSRGELGDVEYWLDYAKDPEITNIPVVTAAGCVYAAGCQSNCSLTQEDVSSAAGISRAAVSDVSQAIATLYERDELY